MTIETILELGFMGAGALTFLQMSKKLFNKLIDKIDVIIDKIDKNSRLVKMQDKEFLNIKNNFEKIENRLQANITGMKISLNAVTLEEITSLQTSLFDIIDNNHFKENINHLNTKIDNSVNKFKTDLHGKVFQMTQDKRIVEVIDENILINEDVKKIFIEEIEKSKTDYIFLKTRVESYLKTMRTTLIDLVYKHYEIEK